MYSTDLEEIEASGGMSISMWLGVNDTELREKESGGVGALPESGGVGVPPDSGGVGVPRYDAAGNDGPGVNVWRCLETCGSSSPANQR